MKNVLITGSSGYIGQHLMKLISKSKIFKPWGLDIKPVGDTDNNDTIYLDVRYINEIDSAILSLNDFPEHWDAVIHLAALVRVNESVEQPYSYYNTNVNGTVNVLNSLSYDNFIFASTGVAENPINPYALSKRIAEDIVKENCRNQNVPYSIFRFYNVIGRDYGIHPTNPDGLMYNLMKAEETGYFHLHGTDYNTPDGTPVRDYIHVMEVCHALYTALHHPSYGVENLGHGRGHSVKEIVETYQLVNNCKFKTIACQRRPGDLESSVLKDVSKYMKQLYTFSELLKK